MKKIKLLLAAFAAMVTMGVNAQSWVASEVGTGNFYLYNVGKGQFLTRGNSWGTQASTGFNAMTLIVEEYDGAYKLRTNMNGDGKGLERLADPVIYTDQSANKNSTWTFTKVRDGNNGPIYTIVSKDNHGGGAGSYMTASAPNDNTIVSPADAVTDYYGHWQLVQAWVTNSMPVADANGWTTSQNPTFDSGNICAEFWNKSGASIKQTISNLPAGKYDLIAVALTREGYVATLNAGTNKKNILTVASSIVNNRTQAKTWFDEGNGVNRLEFTHAGGNLEIGLTADDANGDHWLVWRSFILLYKGVDLSELKAALQDQIDAVPALEGTTTTAAYNAAKNYADGIDVDALTTEEAISTASSELSSRVDAAKALQANYARYNTIKTSATTIATSLDTTNPDAELEAATTNDAVEAAIASLRAAFLAELPNVTIPNDPGYLDVTAVMVDNAGVHTNTDFWTAVENGSARTSGSWAVCNYGECEFYNNNFKFYQTLALTSGTWEFGVTGFHRAGNHSTYFYAGEDKILIPGVESSVVNNMADAKTYFDNGNGKVALKFIIESNQDVEIGIDNQDTQTDKWTIFRDFTLKYYGAPDYSIYDQQWSDAVTAANEALEAQAYKYISGNERTAVVNAIADAPDGSSKANYLEKIQALEAAIATFKAAAPSYNAWVLAKTACKNVWGSALGVADPTTAAEAAAGVDNLKVAQYNEVVTKYTTAIELGDWNQEGGTTFNYGRQHWSGDTSKGYWEQTSENYSASNWNISFNQTIELPAGDYVFKVAGRHSGSSNMALEVSDVTDSDNPVNLGSVNDFPATGTGKGIATDGSANFTDGTFANNGAGWGFQWRYVPFTLTETKSVKIAVTASAGQSNQWVSFCDYTVQAKPSVAASTIAYNQAKEIAEAAIANEIYVNVQGTDRSDLEAAIDADKGETIESIDAATATLNSTTTAFTAGVSSWNALASARSNYAEIEPLPYASAEKKTALENAVNATNINTAAEASDQLSVILQANRQYVESNGLAEGVEGAENKTELLTNAALDGADSGTDIEGWEISCDNTGDEAGKMHYTGYEKYTDGEGVERNYIDQNGIKNLSVTQTIENLPTGQYIFTATVRGQSGISTFNVKVTNSTNAETTAPVTTIGNTGGVFGRGWNDVTVVFEQLNPGSATVGIEASNSSNFWASVGRFRLVRIGDVVAATDEDYAFLNGNLDKYPLGFEAGEFAPYNNLTLVQAIAAAKAIDQEAVNSKEVVRAAAEAITSAGGIANETEANGFYDGFFTSQIVPESNTKPLGWNRNSAIANSTGYEDTGYQTRIVSIPEGVTESNVGMMTKMHAFYGDQEGYTLPLKADTYYTMTFKYAGYNDKPTIHINVYAEDGTKVAGSTSFTTKDNMGHEQASSWSEYSYTFKTTDAGNYVIGIIKDSGATDQKQVVVTDLSLVKTPSVDVTLAVTDAKWATFIAPFDVEIPDGVTAYGVSEKNGNSLTLADVETTIPANTPVILYSDTKIREVVSGQNIATADSYTVGWLTGVYTATPAIIDTYIMQKHGENVGFFKVEEEGITTIQPNRAYLTVPAKEQQNVKSFILGDTATAISGVMDAVVAGEIYDLGGRKVSKMQKGNVYIVNGKKVAVK